MLRNVQFENGTQKKMWKVVVDASNPIETDYSETKSTRYRIESKTLNFKLLTIV